jgi:hypothetical protein
MIAGMANSTTKSATTGLRTLGKASLRRFLQPERAPGDWGEKFCLNRL